MTVVFKHIEITAPHDQIAALKDCMPNNPELRDSFEEKIGQIQGGSSKSRPLGVEVDGFVFAVKKLHSERVALYVKRSPLVTIWFVRRFEEDYYRPNSALIFRPVALERFAEFQREIDANLTTGQYWGKDINFRR